MTTITIDNVEKRFEGTDETGTLALSKASLEINSGEIVSLVGPSGCGKTTLLNLIAGFLFPTSGTVRVGENKVTGPGFDRVVVFQADAVFPWLTVRQNLEYGPRIRGLGTEEWSARVQHYLEIVGLEEFANAHPKELSGGMRKRVDLARAYVNNPEILLMDEPFGALDEFTKQAMEEALLMMTSEEQKTIVFVTHDIEEAIFVGDRVVIMSPRPGKIINEISIHFPQPRKIELKTQSEFQSIRKKVIKMLGEYFELRGASE